MDALPNGTLLRSWGQFSAMSAGPNQVRFESRLQDYLPRTSCVQIPGFNPNCRQAPRPPEMAFTFTFTSPTTMRTEGVTLYRDVNPALLRQPVPEVATITDQAPTQPAMRMPVMPTLHPYVTPHGPGAQAADAYHAQNKAWTDQVMRGCTIAPDDRRWGCEQ